MKLKDLVTNIQDNSNWAVYADSPDPNAEARYGQRQFENGGLLDGKKFIVDGERANRELLSYCDGDLEWFAEHGDIEDFTQYLIDGLE